MSLTPEELTPLPAEGQGELASKLAWTCLAVTLAFLLLLIAPSRGAGWIQDDGLFLRMSWDAANGYGYDQMLPQSPSYLFHAMLMRLGVTEYLHFRYANYVVILISAGLFFTGLARGGPRTARLPIAILASLLVSLNSVQNPNSLSLACFLAGLGIYFHAKHARERVFNALLLLLGGLFFGLAGFMHAAVAIAMFLLVLLILTTDHSSRRSPMLPAFLICVVMLWWWYVQEIGLSVLLARPAGHDVGIGQLVNRIFLLLLFYAKAILLYIALNYYYRKQPEHLCKSRDFLDRAFTAFCLLSLVIFLTGSGMRFPGWLGISQIPGAALFLFYFGFLHWTAQQFRYFSVVRTTDSLGPTASRQSRLRAQFQIMRLFVRHIAVQPPARNLIITFVGFILVPAALAVGSNTAIIQGMVFFAGPALGVLIFLWPQITGSELRRSETIVVSLWMLIFACFALTYNHPNYSPPIAANKTILQSPPLLGISESEAYQTTLKQLLKAYTDYDCAQKDLLVLDYLPMIYFILQHPAPNQIGVIRPQMYFPEEKIMRLLQASKSWCVLDATGIETQTEIDSSNGLDKRARVRNFIQQHADQSVDIPSPGEEILGSMRLYSQSHRSTQ